MIVFEDDWAKYPNAIPDLSTKNKSFLMIADLLKKMGVKHWYFPLALHNPSLAGLSAHDADLTADQKKAMLYEADTNPWFYLRELAKDYKAQTVEGKYFKAHRGNIAAMWMLCANIDYLQIAPRQTGKSFGTDCNTDWLMYFKCRNSTINLITSGEDTRVSNVKRLKSIRDELPAWMNRNTKKDDNNNSTLSCLRLNNKLFTRVSQSSEKAAFKLGRGLTSPVLIIDEAAYIDHIRKTLAAATGGTTSARRLAEKEDMPYCTIMLTTAGNANSRDGKFVYNIWQNACIWDELFYDCKDREEVISIMIKNSKATIKPTMNLTLSHTQLGKTDEQLAEDIEASNGTDADINMDYLNIWETGNDKSLINGNIASKMNASRKDAIKTEIGTNGFITYWYEEYDPDTMYVIGLDTSDAIGRDELAWCMIDAYSGHVVAKATINSSNLIDVMAWIGDQLIAMPNTVLVPENKLNGQTFIDYLTHRLSDAGQNIFKRVFNYVVQGESKMTEQDVALVMNSAADTPWNQRFLDKHKRVFGFMTGPTNRKTLFSDVLQTATKKTCHHMHDMKLVDQLLGLRDKNGRIDHADGEHDDLAVAWLIGHWFLRHGRNLSFYGIDTQKVLSDTGNDSEPTEVEKLTREINRLSSDRLKELSDLLSKTGDKHKKMLLEAEIYDMRNKLQVDNAEAETIDGVIQKAKEKNEERWRAGTNTNGKHTAEALLSQYARR